MENTDTDTKLQKGLFIDSLTRNNSKIREDRARMIVDSARTYYRRTAEDLLMEIKTMKMERENMLDLSPTDANSLTLASDFKASDYVSKDISLGIDIRQKEIEYDVIADRYLQLFGIKLEVEA